MSKRLRNIALLGGLGAAAMMMGKKSDKETKADKGPQEYKDIKGMDVVDETGTKSRLKRSPETGDLYDPEGSGTKPAAKPAPKARPKTEPKTEIKAPVSPTRSMPRITDTGDETERLKSRYPSPVPRTDIANRRPGDVRLGMTNFKKGGMVGSASKRADGIASKGKTRGRII